MKISFSVEVTQSNCSQTQNPGSNKLHQESQESDVFLSKQNVVNKLQIFADTIVNIAKAARLFNLFDFLLNKFS